MGATFRQSPKKPKKPERECRIVPILQRHARHDRDLTLSQKKIIAARFKTPAKRAISPYTCVNERRFITVFRRKGGDKNCQLSA